MKLGPIEILSRTREGMARELEGSLPPDDPLWIVIDLEAGRFESAAARVARLPEAPLREVLADLIEARVALQRQEAALARHADPGARRGARVLRKASADLQREVDGALRRLLGL